MTASATAGQAGRFFVVGGLNTFLTYALLVLLMQFVHLALAYTMAFLVGILISSAVTGRFVFSVRPDRGQRCAYAGWLICVYFVGLAAVNIASWTWLSSPPVLAAVPLLVTVPLNFFGGRHLLSPNDGCERLSR